MNKFVLREPGTVLDEVYDLERSTPDWMRNITTSLHPYMDGGRGTLGAVIDVSKGLEMPVLEHHRGGDEVPALHQFLAGLSKMTPAGSKMNPMSFGQMFSGSGMGTLSVDRNETPARSFFLREFQKQGVADAAALMIPHMESSSVLFFTARQLELARVPARAKPRWVQLKEHIGAVFDLRRRLDNQSFDEQSAAWFDTAGKCIDAGPATDPEIRRRLRAAVQRYESSRTADTAAARVDLQQYWAAVLSGRWAILDRFDTDGRRFIIALPISQTGDMMRGLSERERGVLDFLGDGLSNKAIAHELGVSTTAISTHLYNIFKKLGVDDRGSIVRLVRTVRSHQGARLSA